MEDERVAFLERLFGGRSPELVGVGDSAELRHQCTVLAVVIAGNRSTVSYDVKDRRAKEPTMAETTKPSPPLGEEEHVLHTPGGIPPDRPMPSTIYGSESSGGNLTLERESEVTRRFYILLLGLIVIAALIAVVIMSLDDPDADIAAPIVIAGVAVGSLAALAAHDRR